MNFPKLFTAIALGCVLTVAACGEEETRIPKETGTDTTETDGTDASDNTPTNSDDTDTGGSDTTNPADQATTWCTDVCNHQNECTAQIECQNDLNQCVQGCVSEGMTADTYQMMMGMTCEQIVGQVCSNEANHQYCNCEGVENACPDGQTCFPVSAGAGVCANSDQSFPTDASSCDQENPCTEGFSCVVTEQGATTGSCLQDC